MTHLKMNLDFHPGSQPPKTSGVYLVIVGDAHTMMTIPYSTVHNRFNVWDHEMSSETALRVRWWATLPTWLPWAGPGYRGEG